jgi:hypothetical protein
MKTTTHRTIITRVAIGGATAALLTIGAASTASAVEDTGSTEGNVEVGSEITLTALTTDFTLTGLPGDAVEGLGAVTFNVETNNLAGYGVTVQAATTTMAATAVGNLDSIPIGNLSVRETGDEDYLAVSSAAATPVGGSTTRSAEGGDELSNDYSVAIPFVNQDTYTATLNYIAATL